MSRIHLSAYMIVHIDKSGHMDFCKNKTWILLQRYRWNFEATLKYKSSLWAELLLEMPHVSQLTLKLLEKGKVYSKLTSKPLYTVWNLGCLYFKETCQAILHSSYCEEHIHEFKTKTLYHSPEKVIRATIGKSTLQEWSIGTLYLV
jgi:hypothetical protein